MTKKCIICRQPAYYQIKDTADYYCRDCAEENFSDVEMLVTVEEEAQRLKQAVDERLGEETDEEEEAPKSKKPQKHSRKSHEEDAEDNEKLED